MIKESCVVTKIISLYVDFSPKEDCLRATLQPMGKGIPIKKISVQPSATPASISTWRQIVRMRTKWAGLNLSSSSTERIEKIKHQRTFHLASVKCLHFLTPPSKTLLKFLPLVIGFTTIPMVILLKCQKPTEIYTKICFQSNPLLSNKRGEKKSSWHSTIMSLPQEINPTIA